jgi:myo-inositol-1-phosphate synthase
MQQTQPTKPSQSIRVAIVGAGNCASSLCQGLAHYGARRAEGLMRDDIGGYRAEHIEVVAAYDVDRRKVGRPLRAALQQRPNCTPWFVAPDSLPEGPVVRMGAVLDGVASVMASDAYPEASRILVADAAPQPSADEVVQHLCDARVDILVNYLPVGSQAATEFYAECCLEAGVHLCNCIPVFIASSPQWERRFAERGLSLIGDDMKSQFGASVLSQMLEELAASRGHRVKCHIQRNVGGNTDFLNMTDPTRLESKRTSKENVLRGGLADGGRDGGGDGDEAAELTQQPNRPKPFIHAGPSEYIPYHEDNKIANFHLELEGFMGSPVVLDAQLSVMDSPNSAGVVIDAVRYLKVAAECGIHGAVRGPSAFTQKTPPEFMPLEDAIQECDALSRRELTHVAKREVSI